MALFNKKGELTTTQIVGLIILIASFAIILYFIFRLNPGEITQEQICHNSVILKGKDVGAFSELDCKTNYLCFSSGNTCEGVFFNEDITIGHSLNATFTELSKELASCWWMFGQGESNYASGFSSERYCGICSVVSFSSDFETLSSPTYQSFYEFLEKEKFDDTQNSLHYLYGLSSLNQLNQDTFFMQLFTENIDFTKRYYVLTGIDANLGTSSLNPDTFIPPLLLRSDDPRLQTVCDNFELTRT